MSATNARGLGRAIPSDVKRAVRQRCGFGCVICGSSIYEYEHFSPTFAEASVHESRGITLLCPTHHSEKTRGILPIEVLKEKDARPAAIVAGQTSIVRPYFQNIPSLMIGGGALIENTPVPMMIGDVPVIHFKQPEEGSAVCRIDATITSDDGGDLLLIRDNEWIVESGVWDYEWVGQRMTIRDGHKKVSLQIVVHPPKFISIDRLRFRKDGYDVTATETELRVNGITMRDCVMSNCNVGISLG